MKKTKLTLIISSLIMVLALVVTIVSVSAAWFSNTTSSKIDNGLEIGSDTVQEFVTIKVDSAMGEGDVAIWPAIANPGAVLATDSAELPHGSALKTDGGMIGTAAQTATQYIPLTFVGTPDSWETDGRKSLSLNLDSVTIAKYMDRDDLGNPVINKDEAGKPIIHKDFTGEFCVELAIIAVSKDADNKPVAGGPITVGNPNALTGNEIYYKQLIFDGANVTEGNDVALYMLLLPGTEYYVRATIYFNKIDEECNPELLMQGETMYFNFTLNVINDKTSADIRAMGTV